jgi:hypothetical protein
MTCAQRLKRSFGIDIESRPACGGALQIIACVEDLAVIRKMLIHIREQDASAAPVRGVGAPYSLMSCRTIFSSFAPRPWTAAGSWAPEVLTETAGCGSDSG